MIKLVILKSFKRENLDADCTDPTDRDCVIYDDGYSEQFPHPCQYM